jgi:hypothetical protein
MRPTPPPALIAGSVHELLDHLDMGAGSPVALYGSAGSDTRPLTFLTPSALALRASDGLAELDLPPPAPPMLHVRIDRRRRPPSFLQFDDGDARIAILGRRRPIAARILQKRFSWNSLSR